jgi:hypothetical protein
MCPKLIQVEEKAALPDRRIINAYRHGLTGQVMMFTKPEQEAYNKHCKALLESLAPVGGLETSFAQAVADDAWRLSRASSIENTLIGIGLNTKEDPYSKQPPQVSDAFLQAFAWVKNAKNLNLLTLYESRLHRKMEKNLDLLRKEQAIRKAAEELKPQKTKREAPVYPDNPMPPDFVFSTPKIDPQPRL